jgi:hypothetical protein
VRRRALLAALTFVCLGLTPAAGPSGDGLAGAHGTEPRSAPFLCSLRPGRELLPANARRGLIDHLRQYPVPALATADERRAALALLEAGRRAVLRWPTLRAAAAAGYVTRTAVSRDRGAVGYFHAERGDRRGSLLLDPRDPKALIYANLPGRRQLVVVGVMFSVKRGELGPTPGGPITRWHAHLVCAAGGNRGLKPREDGSCPRGRRLRQGSEMLHLWFTSDLRSAFAIRAPEPELCRDGILPQAACRGPAGLRGM